MSNKIVFGEIDWNAADVSAGQKEQKNIYMRLKEGENVVRVMGNPIQYYVHWVQAADNSKKKLNSPVENPSLVAKLEDAGFRRQSKWLIKVLDREDNEFKVMEVGTQIFNGIKALYNVSIVRGPKGSQPLYNVTPNPKEKLDGSFKEKFETFNTDVSIDKLIAPATAEKVCETMGWKLSDYTSQTVSDTATDDDFDFDFS